MNQFQIIRNPEESEPEFIYRACNIKDSAGLSWKDLTDILNDALDSNKSESYYRKGFNSGKFNPKSTKRQNNEESISELDNLKNTLIEIKKERIKNSDERSQVMGALRRIAREETLSEIANNVAKILANKTILPNYEYLIQDRTESAILEISDWHYGIAIDNHWNTYNPDIAKDRIIALRSRVKDLIIKNNVGNLYIANLGDLISGRIHETIRIQNRIDVISQCLEVAEILVEFISYLSSYANIYYISTSDNHSRLEPKKESSIDLESLVRVIDPLLKARLETLEAQKKCGKVTFIESPYGWDIGAFEINGYKIGAVHGHKDNPKSVVNNISLMTQANYDLILTAHLHHFSCDESFDTLIVSNGSLMGVDDYAETLRLRNRPSQNFILVSESSVAESIHRILL